MQLVVLESHFLEIHLAFMQIKQQKDEYFKTKMFNYFNVSVLIISVPQLSHL